MSTRRPRSRLARIALTSAGLALLLVWALLLRPTILGGPASYVIVSGKSMQPTLTTGDLVVALNREAYSVGDIVTFRVPDGDAGAGAIVIHRITGGSAGAGYITKGDNRPGPDKWRPKADDVLGERALVIPKAGLPLAWIRTPFGLALAAAIIAFLVITANPNPRRRRVRHDPSDPYSIHGRSSRR